jgi:hypothetical protein
MRTPEGASGAAWRWRGAAEAAPVASDNVKMLATKPAIAERKKSAGCLMILSSLLRLRHPELHIAVTLS